MIAPLGNRFRKIGSGEVMSTQMIDLMAQTRTPLLLSAGLATEAELKTAVGIVRSRGTKVGVFQCTSKYPTRYDEIGLNRLPELRLRFGCPVGLSDHSRSLAFGCSVDRSRSRDDRVSPSFPQRIAYPDTAASPCAGAGK